MGNSDQPVVGISEGITNEAGLYSRGGQYQYSDRLDDGDDEYYQDAKDGDEEKADEGSPEEICWDENAEGDVPPGDNNHEDNGGGDWDDERMMVMGGLMTMGMRADAMTEVVDTMMRTGMTMMAIGIVMVSEAGI